ncbi:MAG: 50S ribosomal protein L1 [Candidatus Gracilibacteria bacterium]|jgi:large subunit ribosomal protein L1
MKKLHGKKYYEAKKLIEAKKYGLAEAVAVLRKTVTTKFDPACEAHFNLGLDTTQADQNLRTTVSLPHGTGKEVKVVAFVSDEKIKDAVAAGAVLAGTEELIKKIQDGWLDFDVAVATPDQMKGLGKIAKIIGQKGLMPNPKAGTVAEDVVKMIGEIKKGKIELRLDKQANLHTIFGRASFDENNLTENLKMIFKTLMENKPAGSKGNYIKSVSVSLTMGPSIHLDPTLAMNESK